MLDILTDHLHSLHNVHADITDAMGMTLGHVDPINGGIAHTDALGHVTKLTKIDGDHAVEYGQLGQRLGSWHEVGDHLVHHTPMGMIDSQVSLQGNHIVAKDALGMRQGQWDPLSGSISNALGMIQGFIKKQ